jgi:hypothetical protein
MEKNMIIKNMAADRGDPCREITGGCREGNHVSPFLAGPAGVRIRGVLLYCLRQCRSSSGNRCFFIAPGELRALQVVDSQQVTKAGNYRTARFVNKAYNLYLYGLHR